MKDADFRRDQFRPYSVALGTILGVAVAAWMEHSHVDSWPTMTSALIVAGTIGFGILIGYYAVEFVFGSPPSSASQIDKANSGDGISNGQVQSLDGDKWDGG